MIRSLGIRREDKSKWERRVPLIPCDVSSFLEKGVAIKIQPSSIRCYNDEAFAQKGAQVRENLAECDLLIGVKEMPIEFIQPDKAHIFFSHTIKGQSYNMALLQKFLDAKATLIDYECITDERGRRLIAFGVYAGLAGMIDSLCILGKRLASQGINTPLQQIGFSHEYEDLARAKKTIERVGREIIQKGLSHPIVIGVTGRGKVAKGVKRVLKWLSTVEIDAEELLQWQGDTERIIQVNFSGKHMYREKRGAKFCFSDYRRNPGKYEAHFSRFLPHLTALINGIYWDEKYPRIISMRDAEELFTTRQNSRLQVIGDISCDIKGSIECMVKTTTPDNPAFVYNPLDHSVKDGWLGEGLAILAVDILPAEFSLDASAHFSNILRDILQQMIAADLHAPLEGANLPECIRRAVIVWRGELTPEYRYLRQFLKGSHRAS